MKKRILSVKTKVGYITLSNINGKLIVETTKFHFYVRSQNEFHNTIRHFRWMTEGEIYEYFKQRGFYDGEKTQK